MIWEKGAFLDKKNSVSKGRSPLKGVSPPTRKISVRTVENLIVPARTETVAVVSSDKGYAFVTSNFKPQKLPGHQTFTSRKP